MIKRWLPRRVSTQILLVALLGLLLVQLLGIQIYNLERNETLSLVNSRHAMLRLAAVVRLLNSAPEPLHDEVLRASRSETLMLRLQPVPLEPEVRNPDYETALRRQLAYPEVLAIHISAEQVAPPPPPPDRQHRPLLMERHMAHFLRRDTRLYGTIALADGQWLNFSSFADREPPAWSVHTIVTLLLVAALVSLLMIWLIRRITRPLKQLAAQAEQFGRGESMSPLPESGPQEVAETLAAFNRMQTRLNRFVQDRTQMLAAISHDLRTPLTSLRLRSEFLPEGDDKQRTLETLQQMENMLTATLAFARDDYRQEPGRNVDLVSLLHSLCDDFVDAGDDVTCRADGKLVYTCRPEVLRRVLQNLIGNAIKYAGQAEVDLTQDAQQICLLVRDSGPGIPEAELEAVFKPFVRGDQARNTEDGSVGLGLAIARTLIHQHGGDLSLRNRPEGGLEARVCLPR